MLPFDQYKTLAYDLDGTLIMSNGLKENGFFNAIQPIYGGTAADRMLDIHRTAGSVSRRTRVEMFVRDVLKLDPEVSYDLMLKLHTMIDWHITAMSADVPLVFNVHRHLQSFPDHRKIVVTGAPQHEMQEALCKHSLLPYFDTTFASVRKSETLPVLIETGAIKLPAVYFGDTEDDVRSARGAGMDVVLITCDMYDSELYIHDGVHALVAEDPEHVVAVQDFHDLSSRFTSRQLLRHTPEAPKQS